MSEENSDLSAVYAVVGEFIIEFAHTEAFLHLLFRSTINSVPDAAARIISVGMRSGDMMTKIKELNEALKAPKEKCDRLAYIFKQFEKIMKMRHNFAHRWTNISEDSISSHNLLTSKSNDLPPEKIESAQYAPNMLRAAINDLNAIRAEILSLSVPESARSIFPSAFRSRFEDYTWQYTPPSPKSPPPELPGIPE